MKLTKEQRVGVGFGIFGLITAIVAAIRAKAAPLEYCCPYCEAEGITTCFATLEEVNAHILSEHPGERLLIDIKWD